MEGIGIKETREVLQGVATLANAIREAAADGDLDVSDGFALMANSEVRIALISAAQGIAQVPDEAADLDLSEIEILVGDAFGVIRAVTGKV